MNHDEKIDLIERKIHSRLDDVRLVDGHELGNEGLKVEDLLAAHVQAMLVERRPLEQLRPQAAVQVLDELSCQRLYPAGRHKCCKRQKGKQVGKQAARSARAVTHVVGIDVRTWGQSILELWITPTAWRGRNLCKQQKRNLAQQQL